MEAIDSIEAIYESMNINVSVVVCDTPIEMAYVVDALESKYFPCVFPSSTKKEKLNDNPNKLFVCVSKEFNSPEFWEFVGEYNIDCFFFIGQSVFFDCIKSIQKSKNDLRGRQFIFTL